MRETYVSEMNQIEDYLSEINQISAQVKNRKRKQLPSF